MGARQKLNSANLTGSLVVAGLVGVLTGSWLVFGACLTLMVGSQIASGDIRFKK